MPKAKFRYTLTEIRFVQMKIKVFTMTCLKVADLGDFIGIEGEVFKTRVGEITIDVHQFHL